MKQALGGKCLWVMVEARRVDRGRLQNAGRVEIGCRAGARQSHANRKGALREVEGESRLQGKGIKHYCFRPTT
jgi:hypothetical protein